MATFSVIFSSKRRRKEINDQENLARLLKLYQKLVFSLCLKITHDYFGDYYNDTATNILGAIMVIILGVYLIRQAKKHVEK